PNFRGIAAHAQNCNSASALAARPWPDATGGPMSSMKTRLSDAHLLSGMLTSTVVDALLETMQLVPPATPLSDHSEEGKLLFGVVEHALGVFDLRLIPPPPANPERDYFLSFEGPAVAPTGFRLAVSLEDGPARPLF